MKVYDCFSYLDEDLLLELRLNIMDKFVDYFVIVESNKTWQNNYKEPKFNISKFKKFKDKIIYIKVTDMPDGDNPYIRENYQRNCISKGIADADKEDLIIISDLDEIPDPNKIQSFKRNMRYAVFKQMHFYYKINLQSQINPHWFGSERKTKTDRWLIAMSSIG